MPTFSFTVSGVTGSGPGILDLKKKAISVRWRFLSKIVKSYFEVFGQPLINPRRNHTYPDPFRKKARNWVGCALKRGKLVWQNFVEMVWYNHPNYGISTTEDHCWTQLCDLKRRKANMADSPGNARHNILAPMWFGEIAGALW
jgi:hypothetical protein